MNLLSHFEINAYDLARSPYPWSFNEYSELRTIPACWTIEAVIAANQPSKNGHGRSNGERTSILQPDQHLAESGDEDNSANEAILEWHRNRFLESGDTAAYWALTW